jgi:hypothetical protein
MSTSDRERQPREGSFSPLRALAERRVDPGTMSRENIDTPSPLSKQIPRGQNNVCAPARMPVKR